MAFDLPEKPLKLLKDPELFYDYYVKQFFMLLRYKLWSSKKQNGRINGQRIRTYEQTNKLLYDGIMSDKPFMAGRIGDIENTVVLCDKMVKLGAIGQIPYKKMKMAKNGAGIFPITQDAFEVFAQEYEKSMRSMDVAVFWGHICCEQYMHRKNYLRAVLVPSRPLEPFVFQKPWTRALKGKKVLVVHPFAETILKQYARRDKLFENNDILPEFELVMLKAVQSSAESDCEFESWLDALEFMKKEIEKKDFEVAILGCGGYAMPLAAYIKSLGKKAIVLGGLTQLLFGIKGARWEVSRPDIVAMYNEHWTRAEENEKPKGYKGIEDGAYW